SKEDLGGAMTHNETSGVAHFAVDDDRECVALIREMLSFMPSNNLDDPPRAATSDSADREDDRLDRVVPASPNQPYDMLDVIHLVVDEATVPKVTIITRKAYGGAYCVMSSKHIRTDFNYAWPTAELAVMGPEGAVNILYKRELDAAADAAAVRGEKVAEFRAKFANPYIAAGRGFIDEVIQPRETRRKLITALKNLDSKRDKNPPKKHGNIPL